MATEIRSLGITGISEHPLAVAVTIITGFLATISVGLEDSSEDWETMCIINELLAAFPMLLPDCQIVSAIKHSYPGN